MKMNRMLLFAGIVAAFTAAIHLFAGTREIHAPLLASALAQPIRLLLYACWHLVSVILALSAAALLWSAMPGNRAAAGALPAFVSLVWLLFGLVFLIVAVVFAGLPAIRMLPQWTLLLPVGILAWIGARKSGVPSEHA